MLTQAKSKAARLAAVGTGAAMAAGSAMAVDVYDVSSVTAAASTVAGIGAVVFLVYVAVKVASWVRRAL